MKFIEFRPSDNGKRKYPVVTTKDAKYGEVLSQETISVRNQLCMIVGPHDCGKSRYLQKFYENVEIYQKQINMQLKGQAKNLASKKVYCLYIKRVDNQSEWFLQVQEWYEEIYQKPFKKLTTGQKVDAMCDFLEQTRAVLLVDDIDMVTDKKVQIIKRLVDSAFRCVVTCRNENRIHPSLRGSVMARCGQIVRLDSTVSYDATPVLLAIMMVIIGFAISPMFGAMLLLGGIGKLATGLNATRIK